MKKKKRGRGVRKKRLSTQRKGSKGMERGREKWRRERKKEEEGEEKVEKLK